MARRIRKVVWTKTGQDPERGRIVPELEQPNIRELLVRKYRMIYELFDTRVEILGFIHGARDFAKCRKSLAGDAGQHRIDRS